MPEGNWDGTTYYGRPQLKPAPFNKWLVGGYVFIAGLSGAAQLLATLTDLRRGRAETNAVRRGRYLAMLAPTIGAVCLIADLGTPQRFYNMLRVFKTTSPMSIGSWALVGFSITSTATAALQCMADRGRLTAWFRALARVTQIPAAGLGAVLCTYTASLFSATSTPRWAAAPFSLAVRYASAAVASAAAALSVGEPRRASLGRDLDSLAIAALATELAATMTERQTVRRAGIDDSWSNLADTVSAALALGLFATSLLLPRQRSRLLSAAGSAIVLAGSFAMRVNVLRAGQRSAQQPNVSLSFAQRG